MPTVEGLQFTYVLHQLPPGGWGFRRWGWELWHGATLVAAGWRTTRRDAERALRTHGARFGSSLFGLRGPDGPLHGPVPPGTAVTVDEGPVPFVLRPRALEAAA